MVAVAERDQLPVLDAMALAERIDLHCLIAGIRDHAQTSADQFHHYYAPILDRLLEFAQLLPASESHHHAQPGGLAQHSLETALYALQRRRGLMLPPGAPTEVQQRTQHRWTYAVFLAALLHDAGKAAYDLRITYDSSTRRNVEWYPLAGSLAELGATRYRVDFAHPDKRLYAAHRRFALGLLPKFVPPSVLGWLAEAGRLLHELAEFLAGERLDGPLAELIAAGDRESVRRNLVSGPRQRFASARATPLIERLMAALRQMLADGGSLPLNRDGAAGWVSDGAVWFVSKRLADEVRCFLQAQGDHAVPGEDKNDRLFDVWQEYGALTPNPASGGAVWRARVEGTTYAHELTLLRFPLARLYPEAERFPPAMQGRIVVLPEREPTSAAHGDSLAMTPEKPSHLGSADATTQASLSAPNSDPCQRDKSDGAAALEPIQALVRASTLVDPPALARASSLRERFARQSEAEAAGRQPSPLALTFMAWVQRGVADGSLRYNESGALIHFVSGGLFLVSPGIFRAYAQAEPTPASSDAGSSKDWPGKAAQKAVCAAGWNRKGPRNTSVLRYRVVGREGKPAKTLNGVVVEHPEGFFDPVPPVNPHLQPAPADSDGTGKSIEGSAKGRG